MVSKRGGVRNAFDEHSNETCPLQERSGHAHLHRALFASLHLFSRPANPV